MLVESAYSEAPHCIIKQVNQIISLKFDITPNTLLFPPLCQGSKEDVQEAESVSRAFYVEAL